MLSDGYREEKKHSKKQTKTDLYVDGWLMKETDNTKSNTNTQKTGRNIHW